MESRKKILARLEELSTRFDQWYQTARDFSTELEQLRQQAQQSVKDTVEGSFENSAFFISIERDPLPGAA